MSRWPTQRLGDLALIVMGQSPPGHTYNTDGCGLPFFQGKAEFRDEHPEVQKWCDTPLRIAEAGDVLLSVRAPVGPTNVAGERCCIGRGLAAIRPKTARLAPRFLRYFFTAFESQIAQQGAGSTFDAIGRAVIESLDLPLPPLSEQERIVRILDEVEALRRLRAQANQRTTETMAALFFNVFGSPTANPRGWPRRPFGELARNQDGRRRPVKAADRADRKGEFPYYGASGIIDYVDDYLFDEKALLIAEDGANLLARSTPIAYTANGKYWVNNHAHVVTDNRQAELDYLCAFLNLLDLADYVTGSAQPKLNQEHLNRISIPSPPIVLQRTFAARVAEIRELEAAQDASRQRLHDLFQSLLHRAFQGDL